jgi:pyruvate,water dikinase
MTTAPKNIVPNSSSNRQQASLLWFEEFGIADIPIVGGKNASLGEMIRHLGSKGIRIPNGFATTAQAYRRFLEFNRLDAKSRKLFTGLSVEDLTQLRQVGSQARALILEASFPEDLDRAIREAYARLCEQYGSNTDVAVRSSATAEDLPDASSGQHETYLNVHGIKGLLAGEIRAHHLLHADGKGNAEMRRSSLPSWQAKKSRLSSLRRRATALPSAG